MKYTLRLSLLAASVVAASFSGAQAFAAGFQINELSPSLMGVADAGAAATTGDPSSIGFNPATLATVPGTQAYAGMSVIMPHVGYQNAQGSASPSGVATEPNITPVAYVPNAYLTHDFQNRFSAGLAITVPWGLETDYNSEWAGSDNATESSIQAIDIAPTFAYQLNQYIALGAALHVQHFSAEYDSNNQLSPGSPEFDIQESLTGSSWAAGYSVGVLLTPTKMTHLGLSYRSKITQGVGGQLTSTQNGSSVGDPTPIETHITLPEVINFGLSQMITSKLTGLATAQWMRWDRIPNITVYQNDGSGTVIESNTMAWKNVWMFSLGTQYQLTPEWTLRDGVAYDQTPTQDLYRDPRLPDSNRYWVTAGAEYTPTKNLSFDLSYEHIFMMPQHVNLAATNYDHAVSADYHGHADIIAAGAKYIF